MKTILISPYSKKLRNGNDNPKNYPYWEEVVQGLNTEGFSVVQLGLEGEKEIKGVTSFLVNLPLSQISSRVEHCHTWVSVDNFFQHLCSYQEKRGVVIFGQSDPLIFGYRSNINLLKSRGYLREKQFDIWESAQFRAEAFVRPDEVINAVKQI